MPLPILLIPAAGWIARTVAWQATKRFIVSQTAGAKIIKGTVLLATGAVATPLIKDQWDDEFNPETEVNERANNIMSLANAFPNPTLEFQVFKKAHQSHINRLYIAKENSDKTYFNRALVALNNSNTSATKFIEKENIQLSACNGDTIFPGIDDEPYSAPIDDEQVNAYKTTISKQEAKLALLKQLFTSQNLPPAPQEADYTKGSFTDTFTSSKVDGNSSINVHTNKQRPGSKFTI